MTKAFGWRWSLKAQQIHFNNFPTARVKLSHHLHRCVSDPSSYQWAKLHSIKVHEHQAGNVLGFRHRSETRRKIICAIYSSYPSALLSPFRWCLMYQPPIISYFPSIHFLTRCSARYAGWFSSLISFNDVWTAWETYGACWREGNLRNEGNLDILIREWLLMFHYSMLLSNVRTFVNVYRDEGQNQKSGPEDNFSFHSCPNWEPLNQKKKFDVFGRISR